MNRPKLRRTLPTVLQMFREPRATTGPLEVPPEVLSALDWLDGKLEEVGGLFIITAAPVRPGVSYHHRLETTDHSQPGAPTTVSDPELVGAPDATPEPS